jgi:hypothetical protein
MYVSSWLCSWVLLLLSVSVVAALSLLLLPLLRSVTAGVSRPSQMHTHTHSPPLLLLLLHSSHSSALPGVPLCKHAPHQAELAGDDRAMEALQPKRQATVEELGEVRATLAANSKGNNSLESKVKSAKKAAEDLRAREEKVTAAFASVEKRDIKAREDKKHVSGQVRWLFWLHHWE